MQTQFNIRLIVGLVFASWLVVGNLAPVHSQTAQDDYLVAANHYAQKNWDSSVEAFESLIEQHPESKESRLAKFFLAEIMMQRGEFGPAYRAYQAFYLNNPQHEYAPRATFRMGESAYRTDKYDVAIRVLEEFVKSNPHHDLAEFALPYLGEMRLKKDEPQLAQRAFEAALRLFPNSTISNDSRLGLAKSLQRLGFQDEAKRFYQFLMTQSDPNMQGESHLQLGVMDFGNSEFSTAIPHLKIAASKCSSPYARSEASYWLARAKIELDDHAGAIETFESIVNTELTDQLAVAVLFDGAIAATKIGNDELALSWLKRIRTDYEEDPIADQSIHMAIDIHQRRGESDQALVLINRFRKDHQDSPRRASVLETEGRNHYAAKRYRKTISAFQTLLAENPSTSQADIANWRYLKSLGHLGLGDFDQARFELAQITTFDHSPNLKSLVQLARATAEFGKENYAAAIVDYQAYLRGSKSGTEKQRARLELTISLAETGRWDETAKAFVAYQQNHPAAEEILPTAKFLAERSFEQEQFTHAERWFAMMAEPGNPSPMIARGLSGIAWIKLEQQDSDAAYEAFERLLNECPESRFSVEAAMARAKFLEDRNEFAQAAQTYGLVIRQFDSSPMSGVAKLRRAHALQRVGGRVNLAESRTLLEEYLALPNGNPLADEALYQLAWVLHDQDLPLESHERFSQLVDEFPASKYWSDAAYRVIQQAAAIQNYAIAKPLIEKLLERNDAPDQITSRVLFTQGQIAAADNQWDTVTASMRQLVKKCNDKRLLAKSNYWLAESLYRQQQYEESLSLFENLKPQIVTLGKKLEPWIHLRIAQCHGYAGDWSNAAAVATFANTQFQNFSASYEFDFVIGRGLEDAGQLTDARDAYQRVVGSPQGGTTETAAIAQWRIGETFFHQEDYINAIRSYHKVDSIFTFPHWRSAALLQAGKCQEHLQNNRHAIKLYSQLIENFPDSDFAGTARKRLNRLTAQATAASQPDSRPNPPKNRR